MGREGPGAVVSGEGDPKIFELKGGGIPKIDGGHAGLCTGLRGHSRENWRGGHAKIFQR